MANFEQIRNGVIFDQHKAVKLVCYLLIMITFILHTLNASKVVPYMPVFGFILRFERVFAGTGIIAPLHQMSFI